MALPSTVAEVLLAIKAILVAATWPVAIDANQGTLFNEVHISAAFPGFPLNLVANLPACVVVDRGSISHEENEEFVVTKVGVGLITRFPGDRTGEGALIFDKGLLPMVTEVRKALGYSSELDDSLYLVNTSGAVVLTDAENVGRHYVAKELTFEVSHQDVL